MDETQVDEEIISRFSMSPSPLSFLSLPNDIILNCLSRISRTYHPILSLVSKSFRPLLASPDLQAKTEQCLYVCLNLNNNPTWFVLSPTPNKRKLIPVPSLPYQHPSSSTVVSLGSEIYLIGGFTKENMKTSRRVFVLDCKSHQWRQVPKMSVPRKITAVDVIDGKIYVIGDNSNDKEVYNPKKQTWEPTKLASHRLYLYGMRSNVCVVEVENVSGSSKARVSNGKLFLFRVFCGFQVLGLEQVSSNYLLSVANPGRRNRVTVWWKTHHRNECKTEIWCAQILIHYSLPAGEYQGLVEWSENVFTYQRCESDDDDSKFLLHSALVTLD